MKDIKGYEGLYSITSCGKVYSYIKNRFLKPYYNGSGYFRVSLKGKQKAVHRLVAEAYIDNPKNLPEVNHKDLNKENNCINNLEWCDRQENICGNSRSIGVFDKESLLIFCSISQTHKYTKVPYNRIKKDCEQAKRSDNTRFKYSDDTTVTDFYRAHREYLNKAKHSA